MNLLGILSFAIIIEGLMEYLKLTFSKEKGLNLTMVGAIILGVIIAIAYNIDLLALLGFNSQVPFVGSVLTGILLSRGSNYVSDLIKKLNIEV